MKSMDKWEKRVVYKIQKPTCIKFKAGARLPLLDALETTSAVCVSMVTAPPAVV